MACALGLIAVAAQPSGWTRTDTANDARNGVKHADGVEGVTDSTALVTYLPKVEDELTPTVRPAPRRGGRSSVTPLPSVAAQIPTVRPAASRPRDKSVTRLPNVAVAQTPTVRPAPQRSPEPSIVDLPNLAESKTRSAEGFPLNTATKTATGLVAQLPAKKPLRASSPRERRTLIERRRSEMQEVKQTEVANNLPQPRAEAADLPMVAKSEPKTRAPVPSPLRSTDVVRVETKNQQPAPQSSLAESKSGDSETQSESPSRTSQISPAKIADHSLPPHESPDRADAVAASPTTRQPAQATKNAAPMPDKPSPQSSLAQSRLGAASLAENEIDNDVDRPSQTQVAKLRPLTRVKPLPNPRLVTLPRVAEGKQREPAPRELATVPSKRDGREGIARRPTLFDRALAGHDLAATPPVVTPKYIPYASPGVGAPRPMKLVPVEHAFLPQVGAPGWAGSPPYAVQAPPAYVMPAAAPPVQYLFAQTTTQPNQNDPPPAPPGGDTRYGEAPPSTALQFLRRQSVLLAPGDWQFDVGLAYQIYENDLPIPILDNNGNIAAVADGRTRLRLLSVPLRTRVGISPNFQFFAGTLLGWSNSEISFPGNDDFENIGGIGDINLGGNFRLCEGDFYRPEVIGTLGCTIPSGNSNFDLLAANPQALLGQGFWSLNTSVLCIHSLDPITLFYGAGYLQRFKREFNGFMVTPGAIANYQFGVGFAVNSRVTLSSSFQGFYVEEFNVNGTRVPGTILEPQSLRFAATISKSDGTILEPFAIIGMTDDAVRSSIGMIKTY